MVPVNAVVHREKGGPTLEVVRVQLAIVHHLLDFVGRLGCCVSCVLPPLEHDWLPGHVKEFTVLLVETK